VSELSPFVARVCRIELLVGMYLYASPTCMYTYNSSGDYKTCMNTMLLIDHHTCSLGVFSRMHASPPSPSPPTDGLGNPSRCFTKPKSHDRPPLSRRTTLPNDPRERARQPSQAVIFSHTRHGGKRASGSESESQTGSKVRPVVLTTVHIRARAHRLACQAVLSVL
jgi:hypothetical protein